jgi:hypothetical protein
MASPALTSNYNGDVLDYIITEAVTGFEAVEKGSVYVIPNVPNKISIAKMVSSANPIGAREAMPTTKTATVTWSEATLTPVDMQVYVPDINPRVFESAWREFQPKGALPDKILDPQIQKVFADVVLKQMQNQLGRLIWQGDTTLAASNPLSYFNGYVTRAAASATNIDATNAGVLAVGTILAALENCNNAVPDSLYEDPDMVFHMSTTAFRLYQQADRALTTKGSQYADAAVPRFGGREIRHYAGFPTNKILVAKATTGTDSNFYAATDKVTDAENFVIGKLRPEGEHYFLLAKFKMDANFSIDSESVYYIGS